VPIYMMQCRTHMPQRCVDTAQESDQDEDDLSSAHEVTASLRSRQRRGLASAAMTLLPRAALACSGSPLHLSSSTEQMHHALPALRHVQLRGGRVTVRRISNATCVTAERPRHCRRTARPCQGAEVLAPLQRLGQQLVWRPQRQGPQGHSRASLGSHIACGDADADVSRSPQRSTGCEAVACVQA